MAESHRGVDAIATIPDFVQDRLRETMVFGLPVADADKPTFYFDRQVSWAKQDSEDRPWDWTAVPASDTTPASVQPICTYEFFSPLGRSGAQYSEVGDFYPSTVVFTFVSEADFLEAFGSSYVTIGPRTTKWWFRYWKPELSLGNMPVFEAHFQAEDTT